MPKVVSITMFIIFSYFMLSRIEHGKGYITPRVEINSVAFLHSFGWVCKQRYFYPYPLIVNGFIIQPELHSFSLRRLHITKMDYPALKLFASPSLDRISVSHPGKNSSFKDWPDLHAQNTSCITIKSCKPVNFSHVNYFHDFCKNKLHT